MIEMQEYSKDFEEIYLNKVKEIIPKETINKIENSCKKYLPEDFWEEGKFFDSLIISPFSKLKSAYEYINNISEYKMQMECFSKRAKNRHGLKCEYEKLYNAFYKVANSQNNKESMRVEIVRQSGFTVCPYCNRDYINSRGKTAAGAQLDHFYSKSKYPVFAVSLYNLIPVCGNCNRIKSDHNITIASPFDHNIDWENDISFSFDLHKIEGEKIIIQAEKELENNVKIMKLKEAYQIHTKEIRELIEKSTVYNKSQIAEMKKVLHKTGLTEEQIKAAIFGNRITCEEMHIRPLGKMTHDLHKILKIYE